MTNADAERLKPGDVVALKKDRVEAFGLPKGGRYTVVRTYRKPNYQQVWVVLGGLPDNDDGTPATVKASDLRNANASHKNNPGVKYQAWCLVCLGGGKALGLPTTKKSAWREASGHGNAFHHNVTVVEVTHQKNPGLLGVIAPNPPKGSGETRRVAPRTLRIPDKWLLGMRQAGYTVRQAVAHWQEQERMEKAARKNPGSRSRAGRKRVPRARPRSSIMEQDAAFQHSKRLAKKMARRRQARPNPVKSMRGWKVSRGDLGPANRCVSCNRKLGQLHGANCQIALGAMTLGQLELAALRAFPSSPIQRAIRAEIGKRVARGETSWRPNGKRNPPTAGEGPGQNIRNAMQVARNARHELGRVTHLGEAEIAELFEAFGVILQRLTAALVQVEAGHLGNPGRARGRLLGVAHELKYKHTTEGNRRHPFETPAHVYCLPDGSVQIRSPKGLPLWQEQR